MPILPANTDTLLTISVMGVVRYSARELTQTLDTLDQSKKLRRTVNGALVDVSNIQFRKFVTKITCTDRNVPALSGIWVGQAVTIGCVVELAYGAGGSQIRTPVSGSVRTDANGFTFYRPSLNMVITNYNVSDAEWPAEVAWELDAEEV